ncbi:ATP-binding cassette domain-containing protein [Thermogladius sp. 4427co]|uniref:ATP-binding cassette domain-containing protein n=1 Tax=Thermogladius sp. 4427co TaxID=3450718 RepID=UPI003F7A16C8
MLTVKLREVGYILEYGGSSVVKSVLKDSEFELEEGSVTILTGPSGSGKTTIILAVTGVLNNLLNGYVKGIVDLSGVNPLSQDGFRKVPRYTGIVLQDPDRQIAMPTPLAELVFTLENLGFDTEEARKTAVRYLEEYGLAGKAEEHVDKLSMGEKRKLTIASALVHKPSLIILDEPTASLDPWSINIVARAVEEFKKRGLTVLIAEHKPMYFTRLADRELRVVNGKLVEESVREVEIEIGGDRKKSKGERRVLYIRDLEAGYGTPLVYVDELEVYEGEIVAIAGPNGSGKTTLLKTIAGFLKPLRYEVLDKKKSFYVPQNPDFTFIYSSVEKELKDAAKQVSFSELSSMYPWFNETREYNPFKLSHGQRRWLANLIAYGYSRELVLLDEPSTGLDDSLFTMLTNIIRRIAAKGAGILISTHDPRILNDLADRAYFVTGRKLVEKDPISLAAEMYKASGIRIA